MTAERGGRLAVAALAAIAGVTVVWWALALWPVPANGPEWLVRTRAVCFGVAPGGLPNAGGWVLLVSQPFSMVAMLWFMWRDALGEGLAAMRRSFAGRSLLAASVAVLIGGAVLAIARVRWAIAEPVFVTSAASVRVLAVPPSLLHLVDQRGQRVTLAALHGRPVLVAFAYAHCETVCPLLVHDLLALRTRLGERAPVLVIMTLDPWRDTPERLPTIAAAWGLPADAHVLSGAVPEVERALDAWEVVRVRDGATGAVTHTEVVYVIAPDGGMTHRIDGNAQAAEGILRAF